MARNAFAAAGMRAVMEANDEECANAMRMIRLLRTVTAYFRGLYKVLQECGISKYVQGLTLSWTCFHSNDLSNGASHVPIRE